MSNLPEVAQSSGLEVNHDASAPTVAPHYYTSPQQYGQQPQVPAKGEYIPVGDQDPPKQVATPLICGVRRSTFWLAVILAVVVVAAAVGGGVGGSIAVSNARSSPTTTPLPARETLTITPSACITTPSPTGTSPSSESFYTPTPPRDVLRIDVSCPNATISSPNAGAPVDFKCVEHKDASLNDVVWFTAYTLQACIDGCTAFNRGVGAQTDVKCKGVALGEDLSHQAVVNAGANCWLKTKMNQSAFSDSQTNTVAWLVDDP